LYRLRVRFILVVIFASDLIISFIFTDEKDEVSRESIKKERDRKRYAEMPPLLRHEKIVKTNEGRRQKNNYLTGWIYYFAEDYNFFYMCTIIFSLQFQVNK